VPLVCTHSYTYTESQFILDAEGSCDIVELPERVFGRHKYQQQNLPRGSERLYALVGHAPSSLNGLRSGFRRLLRVKDPRIASKREFD
jgi:hypothetical protein